MGVLIFLAVLAFCLMVCFLLWGGVAVSGRSLVGHDVMDPRCRNWNQDPHSRVLNRRCPECNESVPETK